MTMRRIFASLALLGSVSAADAQSTPTAVIDRAIERLGGAATLQKIERVRFEQMTLWHRQTFEDRPVRRRGGLVRARHRPARLHVAGVAQHATLHRAGAGEPEIVDVVRDDVAIRLSPTAPNAPASWNPLNIAYLDERRELFAFAPERLLLAARAAVRT